MTSLGSLIDEALAGITLPKPEVQSSKGRRQSELAAQRDAWQEERRADMHHQLQLIGIHVLLKK